MARPTNFLVIYSLCYFLLSVPAIHASLGSHTHHQMTLFDFPASPSSSATMVCSEGSNIGECLGEEEDMMESESTRRMLAVRRRYISYGALSRNRVPCSRRGASYYNCRPGGPANAYSRGCSRITRCRR